MRRHGDQCVVGGSVRAAIRRLHARRVHALDRQLEEVNLVIVAVAAHSDDGVQRDLHVRQLLWLLVGEEADDAAKNRLMRHHQDVIGSLQFGYHRLHALHRVDVALAPRVTIT